MGGLAVSFVALKPGRCCKLLAQDVSWSSLDGLAHWRGHRSTCRHARADDNQRDPAIPRIHCSILRYSHSSQVRCDFWHARHAFATFLRAPLPSVRLFLPLRGGLGLASARVLVGGDASEWLEPEPDAETDASDVSLAFRDQEAWRSCMRAMALWYSGEPCKWIGAI